MYSQDERKDNTFVDLFCGCGGLALGFEQAGFRSVYAADLNETACRTYERNFHHPVFCGDIADLDSLPEKPELIVGGPPCQGFSPLGRMTPSEVVRNNHVSMNKLWEHYFRLVEGSMPRAFVVENVPQLLTSKEFPMIVKKAEELGYNVVSGVLKAEQYGVPQKRTRGIIIGGLDFFPGLPSPTRERKTVWDAIGDLPLEPTGKDLHIGRKPTAESLERYRCIPPGGNRFDLMRKRPDICPECWLRKKTGSTDVFGRLKWDEPSLTIRTEFYKPEKGCYLHPSEDRPITYREAARLQTFPDDFVFEGSKIEIARMIGNSVPPKLAYHVAIAVKKGFRKPIEMSTIPLPLAQEQGGS